VSDIDKQRPGKKQPNSPSLAIEPSAIDQLLRNQAQELLIREEEIKLKQGQISGTTEIAKESIRAQLEDRERDRQNERRIQRERLVFYGFVGLLITIFVTIALVYNKEQVALEVIKTIAFLLTGGVGGYSLGRRQAASSQIAKSSKSAVQKEK
jgi:hypothetical protein